MPKDLSENPAKNLVKIGEAARILGVSIDTLRRWEQKGKISAIRTPGGTRLYPLDSLLSVDRSIRLKRSTDSLSTVVSTEVESGQPLGGTATGQKPATTLSLASLLTGGEERLTAGQGTDWLTVHTQNPSELEGTNLGNPTYYNNKNSKIYAKTYAKIRVLTGLARLAGTGLLVVMLLTATMAGLYLIRPEQTKQFFADAAKTRETEPLKKVVGTVLGPFNQFALAGLKAFLPDQAGSIGLLEPRLGSKPVVIRQSGVLAVSENADSNSYLQINADTDFTKNIVVEGEGMFKKSITAPNLLYGLNAGANVAISPGQTPTISVSLPSLVTSVQGLTGAVNLAAGTDISISGLTISNSSTLSTVRGRGGCSGCITNGDLATVGVGTGGTNLTTYTKGDILYTSATDTLSKLAIGTSGQVLSVSGGLPVWSANTAGVSTIKESGSPVVTITGAGTLNFLGGDFDISESPTGTANVQLATTLTTPTGVAGNFDIAGTLTSGTGNAFQVSAAGGITIPSTQTLTVGTIGLSATGSSVTTSGASLIGVFDNLNNSSSSSVQGVLKDLDSAIGAGSSKWTQQTGFIYLTTTTDSVVVGGSTTGSGKLYFDTTNSTLNLGTNESINGTLRLYSSGVSITDPTLAADSSGNLIVTAVNFTATSTGINATAVGATTPASGAFTTLSSSGNTTLGSGASSTVTVGATTTPGALTLHGPTTLDNTLTVSGNNLTTLGGSLTFSGANPTIQASTTNTGLTLQANGTGALTLGASTGPTVISGSNFSVSSAGAVTAATSTNTINGLIINSGALSSITGFSQSSGTFSATAGAGNGVIDLSASDVLRSFTFTNSGSDTVAAGTPDFKLIVKGGASQAGNLTEWQTSAGAVLASVSSAGVLTLPANGLVVGGSGGSQLVASSGNIGIGTASPGTLLTIHPSTAGSALAIRNTADSANTFLVTDAGVVTSGSWQGTAVAPGYGGTGQTAVASGDLLYGSASNAWSRLAIGTSGKVLTVSGGLPAWSSVSSSTCPTCVVTDPTATQTIAPTGAATTGLSVAQTSTASPTADIFNVTNSTGATKYLQVNSSGNLLIPTFTSNGGPLYTNGSGQLAQTTAGTTTQVLHGGTTPSFGAVALASDVSGALPVVNGGTGLSTAPTNGQLLIGNGTGYTLSTLTAGNGMAITNGAGSITLATNIVTTAGTSTTTAAASGLEFNSNQLTLLRGCANGQLLKWNGAGGSPANTWVCSNDAGATSAIINVQEGGVAVGTNVDTLNFTASDLNVTNSGTVDTIALDYANSKITRSNQNEDVTGLWNFQNASGITLGLDATTPTANTAGSLKLISAGDNAFYTTITAGTQTATTNYTWPTAYPGSNNYVLASSTTGTLSWLATGTGGVGTITAIGDVTSGDAFTSGGTQGTALYFHNSGFNGSLQVGTLTAAQTYTLPNLTGTFALLEGSQTFTGAKTFSNSAGITLGLDATTPTANTAGSLKLISAGDNAFYTTITAATQTANVNYTLPVSDGSSNYVLTTNGAGTLSWQSVTGVGAGTGDITAVGDVTSGDAFTSGGTQGTALYFHNSGFNGSLQVGTLTAGRTYTLPDIGGTFDFIDAAQTISATKTFSSASPLILSGVNPTVTASGGNVTLDLTADNPANTLTLINSTVGTNNGVANLNLSDGSLQTGGTARLTNSGGLQNITGFSQSSGTFSATAGAGNGVIDLSASDVLRSFTFTNSGSDTVAAGTPDFKLIVKGGASQAGNLTEWQTSAGAVLASVSSAGVLTLPANGLVVGGSGGSQLVASSGNIGIGTASPGTLLTIHPSTAGSALAIRNTADSANTFLVTDAGVVTSGSWQGTAVAPGYGGTGISTAASTGVPSISSGTWSVNTTLPVSLGGTGASTAAGARTNLGAAASGANSDITSLSGLVENGNLSTSYAVYLKRNTDTSPTGYLIQAQNAAASANLFTVDTTGAVTSGSWQGTAVAPGYGGTGISTAASTGVPSISSGTWSVSSALATSLGGTGLTTTPSNGQLLIGNGTGYTLSSLTAGNGISVTNGAGTITLALGSLTSDWIQSGAFNIKLDNATSRLVMKSGDSAAFYGKLDLAAIATDKTYTLPSFTGANATICLSTGNCTGSSAGIGGTGTSPQVAFFTASQTLASDPVLNIDGTNHRLGIGTATPSTQLEFFGDTNIALFDPAAVTTDGGSYNSPIIRLQSRYDADPLNTISSASQSFDLRTIQVTSNTASPTSRFGLAYVNNAGASTEVLSVLNSGSVGIGTATPASLLSVGSTSQFQVNSSGAIAAATGITSSGTINFSGLTASSVVATDGSKNLVSSFASSVLASSLTDETGSGSVVFSTSPSLVTPSLGAATATSINSLTLSSNTDGFAIAGGTTSRTLTVSGGNASLNQNLTTTSSPTFSSLNLSAASNQLALNSAGVTGTLTWTPTTTAKTITLPDATGTVCVSGQTCAASGTVGYWTRTVGGVLSPSTATDLFQITPSLATSGQIGLENSLTISGSTAASTYYGQKLAITNNQTTNPDTVYGQHISFTDAGTLANTVYGLYVDPSTANAADTTYAAVFAGGNVGIGSAATTPGNGLLQLSNTSSTTDLLRIDNGSGTAVTTSTNGVDAIQLALSSSATSGNNSGINIAGITNTAVSGTAVTRGINVSATGVAAGTLYGINLGLSAAGAGTEYGLNIGSGWDRGINTASPVYISNSTITSGSTGSLDINDSSSASNNVVNIAANGLTSGSGINLTSTSTTLSTGSLLSLAWNPASNPTTAPTGDLFSLNLGLANSNFAGNFLNIKNNGSSLFSVSQSAVTASIPASFTSAGDVSIAYDLSFTNPTVSYIKSQAPLVIQPGETFNSSDLTLKTFNQGSVVVDSANTTGNMVDILGSTLTSGVGINFTGSSSVGITGAGIKLTSDVGSAGTLLSLNPDFSGAGVSGYGLYLSGTDATANANTNYGVYSSLSDTGVVGTAVTKTNYGGYFTASKTGTSTAGTLNTYGLYASATGTTDSTSNAYGLYAAASGADTNYGVNIAAISTAATTNAGINIGNISGAVTTNYAINIGTLTGGAGSSVYGINTGALTSVASGTNFQLNSGTVAGAASATFGSIQTGALSGVGTTSYGINLGANSSTATTNYGIKVGAISGAGTTNYGLYVDSVTGATNNYAAVFAGGNVGIGTTSPSQLLQISAGNLSVTGSGGLVSFEGSNATSAVPNALLLDKGATNLITNPSIEVDTTGWSGIGTATVPTLTRVTTDKYAGSASMEVNKTGADNTNGAQFTPVAISSGKTHTASVWMKQNSGAGNTVQLSLTGNGNGGTTNGETVTLSTTQWVRYAVTMTAGSTDTTLTLKITSTATQNLDFLVDAAQLEQAGYATSYADGSLGPGYTWSGTANASSSVRTAGMKYLNPLTAGGLAIGTDGKLALGTNGASSGLSAYKTLNVVDTSTVAAATDYHMNIASVAYASAAGPSSSTFASIDATAAVTNGNAQNYTGLFYGVGGATVHLGTGTLTTATGVSSTVWNGSTDVGQGGNGIITNGYDFYATGVTQKRGTGSITNTAGLYVNSQTWGSTTNYGVYINQPGLSNGLANTTDSIGLYIPTATTAFSNQTATTTNAMGINIGQQTYTSTTNTRTITNAASLYIAGAPVAGSNVTFGSGAATSTSGYALWVAGNGSRFSGNPPDIGNGLGATIVVNPPNLTSTTNGQVGVSSLPVVNPGSASTQTYAGYLALPATTTNANLSGATLTGYLAEPEANAGVGNTVGNVIGFESIPIPLSGTTTNNYGFYAANPLLAGGTITNNTGLLIEAQTAGTNNAGLVIGQATGTKQTNLLIGTTTQPTGSFSIYNSSASQNYFAGNVGIGTVSPSSLLHLVGSQPAAVATNGTNATQTLQITGGKGGNTTGTTGQLAGIGAVLNLTAGAGGDAPTGSTNGNGGSITLQGGAPGTGAGGTGSYGNVSLNPSGGNVGIGTSGPAHVLELASSTLPAGGIGFGTDANLYRSGASTLQTDSDFQINAAGSSTTSPRIGAFSNMTTGTATRFQFGDNSNGFQTGYNQDIQIYTYNGLQLIGRRNTTGPPAFTPWNTNLNVGVLIPNTDASVKALVIRGAGGQTQPLLELQSSLNTILTTFDSSGKLGIGTSGPAAQLDILAPATTTGIQLAGTAPAAVATNGTNAATNILSVVGTAGGDSSGTTGQTGGTGAGISLTGGAGGAVAGAGGIGGIGGAVSVTAGAGGNGATTGGAGGALTFTAGAAGTGGNANGGTLALNSGAPTGTGTSTINLGSANTTNLNIGTAAVSDTITIGNSTGTTNLSFTSGTGAQTFTSSVATGTTTNSAFVFKPSAGTSGTGIYVQGLGGASPTGRILDINATNVSGTLANLAYGAATTQGAGALTGLALDLSTNLTTPAAGQNVTGINLQLPIISTTSNATTYSGFNMTAGSITSGTAGSITWNGANITIPGVTQNSGGSVTATGLKVTTGAITTGGTENGIYVAATGVGAGTLSGINIGSITGGAGSETALSIGAGWDIGINSAASIVTTSTGSVGIGTANFGGATGPVLALGNNGATAPSAVASQGILYVSAGALKYQGPTTLTTVAAADYAEDMPYLGNIQPGELVSASATPNPKAQDIYGRFYVEKTGKQYDRKIVGIVSAFMDPNTQPKETRPISLVGRVPVKVSTENGPIERGDLLTSSSIPGVAMKATRSGWVVGKALESYGSADPTQVGKVLVFVNVGFADPGNILTAMTIDSDGRLITPDLKTNRLALDGTGAGITVNGSAIDLATLTQTGSLASTVSALEQNYRTLAENLTTIRKTQDDQTAQIASVKTQTDVLGTQVASQSAQLADIKSRQASDSSTLADLRSRIDSLAATSAATQSASPGESGVLAGLTDPGLLLASSSTTLTDLKVTSSASTLKLDAIDATVSGTLSSLGETRLGSTIIAGDLTVDGTFSVTGGNTINSLPTLFVQNSPLAGGVDFFNGLVTIDKTGKLVAQEVEAKTVTTGGVVISAGADNPSIGSGIIPKGKLEVAVLNSRVDQKTKIFITPRGKTGGQSLAVTGIVDKTGFVVNLDKPLTQDLPFDWWIVGVK